ncbi:MAG: carboxypeptidase-like regulatory domain-containing protein [Blastocatellia bacterium]|nr:carboxypeptidase-like regulatory domain-containing protein [Blastocatellia bacterium]
MSKHIIRHFVSLVLLLSVVIVPATAQEFRGSITGKVKDPSGAVLPGAMISVKNVETNITTNATTNEEGIYNIALLLPGKYMLTVKMQGFNTSQQEGIEVRVGDRLTLDVTMEVGVVESVMTVTATSLIDASSATTGQLVNSRQISELPLADGTAYVLTNLAAGITYTGDPKFSRPADNANLAAFRSNGTTGANQITLDGSPNLASQGRVGFSPPSDAVQEFKVETNSFDAQQGYTAGANVNVATKGGTNDLHGTLYYFSRNENRAANDFFANKAKQGRSPRDYKRYGGTVGGPVFVPKIYDGRNKTFFFFAYEGLDDVSPEPQIFTVPTERMRRGDLSEFLAQNVTIFDPFTGRRVGSRTVRDPLACNGQANVICANRINPIAGALINLYPLPNQPGLGGGTVNNFFSPQTRTYDYDGILARADHNINQNHKLFGKFYWNNRVEDRYNWAGVISGVEITRGFDFRENTGGNLDYTATLSPTLIFDIRSSVSKFGEFRRPGETFDLASLGFSP